MSKLPQGIITWRLSLQGRTVGVGKERVGKERLEESKGKERMEESKEKVG